MTPVRLACCTLALCTAGSVFAADALPHRKSGLWEIQMAMSGKPAGMGPMQTCVDQASDDVMQSNAQRATAKNCTVNDIKRDGNRVLVHSECTIDKTQTISDAVFTGDFDSAYRGDITSRYNPPMAGMSQSQITITARWLGACKPGQKGGDMIINGMTINASGMKQK
jgi:hypothetical protein